MFELVLILGFLASIAVLAGAAVSALLGRSKLAGKLLVGLGVCLAVYLGIVAGVSLASPQRVLALGEDRCFDDWCVAVENVEKTAELGQGTRAEGVFYVVTLRLSNQARGREQRASSAAVHLLDSTGRVYDLSPSGQAAYDAEWGAAAPLTSSLAVGQSLNTVQVFDLPKNAQGVGLAVEHPVGFSPGLFVIGDEASLLHKPTIVRLP